MSAGLINLNMFLSNYHTSDYEYKLKDTVISSIKCLIFLLSPNELLQVNPLENYIYRESSAKRKHQQLMDTILCCLYLYCKNSFASSPKLLSQPISAPGKISQKQLCKYSLNCAPNLDRQDAITLYKNTGSDL
ncbi:hypothetical protein HKD37_08G021073 [Glycine soja]